MLAGGVVIGRGIFLLHIVRHFVYTVGSVDCRVVWLKSCRRYDLLTPTITQRVLKRIPGNSCSLSVVALDLCMSMEPIWTKFRDTVAAKYLKIDRARDRRNRLV